VDEPATEQDAPLRDDMVWRFDVERTPARHLGHGRARYPDLALRDAIRFIREVVDASSESPFLVGGDVHVEEVRE
jgi:hypothetical protein